MAFADPYQANDFPGDLFSLHQPHNHALHDARVPPAPANNQPEDHREDIPPLVTGVIGPGRIQELPQFDVAYHAQSLNPLYLSPDVAQGIQIQAQPSTPVNLECNSFGYIPQHNAQAPVPVNFPHPSVHRTPTPNQGGAENLRRLASRYLHHPGAQVGTVCMEAGTGGRFRVVIVLESHEVF